MIQLMGASVLLDLVHKQFMLIQTYYNVHDWKVKVDVDLRPEPPTSKNAAAVTATAAPLTNKMQ